MNQIKLKWMNQKMMMKKLKKKMKIHYQLKIMDMHHNYHKIFRLQDQEKIIKKKKSGNLDYKYQANFTHKFLKRIGINPLKHRLTYGMISAANESDLQKEITRMKKKYSDDVRQMIKRYDTYHWTNIAIYCWNYKGDYEKDNVSATVIHGAHYYDDPAAKKAYKRATIKCKHCIGHQQLEKKKEIARRKRELHPFYHTQSDV